MPQIIKITKASGKQEPFNPDKVRQSLRRAGAQPATIDKILVQLTGKLHQGMTTREIYSQVFAWFNQYQGKESYRYGLKDSLMQLGPSGYPFEKFIAKILTHLGYTTQINQIIPGRCLEHEIDVVAVKEKKFLVECKFHNHPGTKTRSRDSLCLQARFEDVAGFDQAWLITNTKLSSNAIKYSQCCQIRLLAWRYPPEQSLEKIIEANNFYPLTCLTFLNQDELNRLYQQDLVLFQDLKTLDQKRLEGLGLSSAKLKDLQNLIFS